MRAILSVVAGLALLACQPIAMLPGGGLRGTVEPVPSDWSFSDAIKKVQLESRPSDPYSVNVWGVGVGERFYVAAGDSENNWVRHIAADPRVRLKLGSAIYELRATRTDDPAELDAFLEEVKQKYDFEPEPEQREKAVLFRLEPR